MLKLGFYLKFEGAWAYTELLNYTSPIIAEIQVIVEDEKLRSPLTVDPVASTCNDVIVMQTEAASWKINSDREEMTK